jgi:hypothetical protein
MAPPPSAEKAKPPPSVIQRTSSRSKKRPPGQDNSNLLPESPLCSKKASTAASRGLKRKVPHISKNSNSLEEQLHAKSVECVHALTHLADTALAARDSLSWLDSHPTSRNLLMAASPTKSPAYTTEEVLQAHVGPHTQDGFIPKRSVNETKESVFEFSPILGDKALKTTSASPRLSRERSSYLAKFVLPGIWQNYPNLFAASKSFTYGVHAFALGILGPNAGIPKAHVSFLEVHRRMLLADKAFLEQTLADNSISRPNANHAKAWQVVNTATLDKRQILIDACGAWFPHLQRLTSAEFLDVLAGVDPKIPFSFPSSASNNDQPPATAPTKTKVDHVQLRAEGGTGRSLGSVFHLENCFSPSFIHHAMEVGIPSLPFMRDGMKKGKDRLSRIASQKAGTPFSLRKDKPYLMLSDVTIAFEADMLKVGNYLNAHLHAFVKSYVEELYGRSAVELVVPPLVVFDLLQSSLNSLVDGGYAAHDDSGTFVTDNDLDYGDEDHNMIVITFFWTNRKDVPTNVTWYENGQPRNKRSIATMQAGTQIMILGPTDF